MTSTTLQSAITWVSGSSPARQVTKEEIVSLPNRPSERSPVSSIAENTSTISKLQFENVKSLAFITYDKALLWCLPLRGYTFNFQGTTRWNRKPSRLYTLEDRLGCSFFIYKFLSFSFLFDICIVRRQSMVQSLFPAPHNSGVCPPSSRFSQWGRYVTEWYLVQNFFHSNSSNRFIKADGFPLRSPFPLRLRLQPHIWSAMHLVKVTSVFLKDLSIPFGWSTSNYVPKVLLKILGLRLCFAASKFSSRSIRNRLALTCWSVTLQIALECANFIFIVLLLNQIARIGEETWSLRANLTQKMTIVRLARAYSSAAVCAFTRFSSFSIYLFSTTLAQVSLEYI